MHYNRLKDDYDPALLDALIEDIKEWKKSEDRKGPTMLTIPLKEKIHNIKVLL